MTYTNMKNILFLKANNGIQVAIVWIMSSPKYLSSHPIRR